MVVLWLAIVQKIWMMLQKINVANFSQKEDNFVLQNNRNKLLFTFDGADGMKTGHTEAAGYCLVSSAKQDGERYISVVLGKQFRKTRN